LAGLDDGKSEVCNASIGRFNPPGRGVGFPQPRMGREVLADSAGSARGITGEQGLQKTFVILRNKFSLIY
jgi:hypothetical protein